MSEELTPKEKYEQKKAEKHAEKEQHDKETSTTSPNKMKPVLFIVAGLLVLWGAWSLFKGPSASDEVISEALASEWVKGSEEATVELVEYGDFQCPACGAVHPLIKQLHEEFEDDLKIVFRHFPLTQIHPNALPAARAAEAAGVQGKFFEMHDKLFENQGEWSNTRNTSEIFERYASEIGIDVEQYKTDVSSDPVKDKVSAHTTLGIRAGVQGTPTFILNGETLGNYGGYEGLVNLILAEFPEDYVFPSLREEGEHTDEGAEQTDDTEIVPAE